MRSVTIHTDLHKTVMFLLLRAGFFFSDPVTGLVWPRGWVKV